MVNVSTLFVSLLALATSAAAAAHNAQPPIASVKARGGHGAAQPPLAAVQGRDSTPISARQIERLTNAERFARGEPPNPPMRRNRLEARTPQPSGTPGRDLSGKIQVSNAKTGAFIGYLSKSYKLFGEYGVVPTLAGALKVTLKQVTNGKSGPIQILGTNGDATYPNLGATVGYWNSNDALSTTNSNYLYIGGTAQTAPGATPQVGGSAFNAATGASKHIESGVWYFKTQNRKITLSWVNPDGSVVDAKFFHDDADGVIFATGNVNKFSSEYGDGEHVVFTLVDD